MEHAGGAFLLQRDEKEEEKRVDSAPSESSSARSLRCLGTPLAVNQTSFRPY